MRPIAYPGDKVFIIIQETRFEPKASCKECNGTGKVRYKNYLITCPACKCQRNYLKIIDKIISIEIQCVSIYKTYCFYEFSYKNTTLKRLQSDIFLTEEDAKERLKELTSKETIE